METATTGPKPPAAGGTPVRLLGSGPRRWRWLGFGVALMAAGSLVAAFAVEGLDERRGVLVASGDLPAGHVVTASDLRVARLSGTDDLSVVGEDQLAATIGRTLTVPVTEGAVLPETALGAEAGYPEAGQAMVGASLPPGRFPVSLRAGAQVSVVVTNSQAGGARGAGVEAYPAHVQTFEAAAADGPAVIELVVDAADAAQISAAAAAEQITVVQVSPNGGA
ncbi:SAF domain-containing protein [Marinactinospora thermotolerans]|uniref:SAF domain-containing protein n=1 Tax=Marinactinospora thermotolerans DSM 45154 TaxID=1122192 RepID=A0A1T4QAX7_9ACTN|nr:SAF domain-containing protein [Marinactinospora thermotolerans]SKA00932.1 SAF domain-containing protein [Marinactinospora thermotolerans DSM 45154]